MKKLYYAEGFARIRNYHEDLKEIINRFFHNFSVTPYKRLSSRSCRYFYTSLNEALAPKDKDNLITLTVIEYSLSEEDMYNILLLGEIQVNPTDIWYYWYNENTGKMEEIKKDLSAFY